MNAIETMIASYEPPPRSNLSNAVAAELARRIVFGELTVGARLPNEGNLCALFRVSRSVVRDAIRMLLTRGLVSVRQGHGTIVTEPTDSTYSEALLLLLMRSDFTMGDVVEARMALETQLAPLAADRGTDEDLNVLEQHLAAFAEAVDEERWDDARDAHLAFHLSILRAIRIPALELILRPLEKIVLISSLMLTPTDADYWEVDAHPPILDGLRRRDEEAVRQAMERHFANLERNRYGGSRAMRFRDSEAVRSELNRMLGWATA